MTFIGGRSPRGGRLGASASGGGTARSGGVREAPITRPGSPGEDPPPPGTRPGDNVRRSGGTSDPTSGAGPPITPPRAITRPTGVETNHDRPGSGAAGWPLAGELPGTAGTPGGPVVRLPVNTPVSPGIGVGSASGGITGGRSGLCPPPGDVPPTSGSRRKSFDRAGAGVSCCVRSNTARSASATMLRAWRFSWSRQPSGNPDTLGDAGPQPATDQGAAASACSLA